MCCYFRVCTPFNGVTSRQNSITIYGTSIKLKMHKQRDNADMFAIFFIYSNICKIF